MDIRKKIREFSLTHGIGHDHKLGENVFDFDAPNTKLRFHSTGLGDLMIVRQVGQAFQEYLSEKGDPELGKVVIATGGFEPGFHPDEGDINCYWWWSLGPFDESPDEYFSTYVENTSVLPDIVFCPSGKTKDIAENHGFRTLYLPLGTSAFEPLGLDRSGVGYAGSKGHKKEQQVEELFGDYVGRDDFEWVDNYTTPTQLNLWYNTKEATFGLTRAGQRQYGMVNNRVFETLASGTPLILEPHPFVEDVLGFDYPYQPETPQETEEMVQKIRTNPEKTRDEFKEYAEKVRSEHSYRNRIESVMDALL